MDLESSRASPTMDHYPADGLGSFSLDMQSNTSTRNHHSVLDLPNPGTRTAPRTFRGRPNTLKLFLRQFEKLAALHSLSSEEKCKNVGDYCSQRVQETIEGFGGYRAKNWTDLAKICHDYQTEKSRTMNDIKAWKAYVQDYYRVAGSLLNNGKLTTDEFATQFWIGIPRRVRDRVEIPIRTELGKGKVGGHPMSKPFPVETSTKHGRPTAPWSL
ncbi:hypothetical protein BXZ70DRAFT_1059645 [Cristinia sonorae]|uniref:Uncharacterized protein n=1 Tax=Cristinia sonorae TaxID=1940300 RepID=A0A8K0UEQ3_9AGAR|nr:hypothetical protein BXZ70DRAFT_1059645 [Cristinia sonorae]